MSLQNIVLPDSLLADLYKNISIVIPPAKVETIRYLGKNAKKIALVVNHPADVFLSETHLEFLSRVLAAFELNIGDVAIVNIGNKFVNIHAIKQQLKPNRIILFGIEPTELKLPLSFPHFKIQGYADSAYLSVPPLNDLNNDTPDAKLLKTKLWVCLKTIFEVHD